MKPAIVIGNTTDHGGIVSTGDSTYLIDGKAAHVEGMTHFCPKCKVMVTALSSSPLVVINGRAIIVAGDKASCGATFLPSQSLWVRDQGISSGSGSSSTNDSFVQNSEKENSVVFQFNDPNTGKPLTDFPYELTLPSGEKIQGKTNRAGKTELAVTGVKPEQVKIETLDLSEPMPPLE
ncbi:PAAR domain-containing protein [Acinetobacter baumannii]|uniref:PAAR domain-containing protein n=1 Tax=Acinetobacter baumannii TaxID=470 RepID=UPI0007A37BE2|nr:PAAR domain-containing protein [Acinetobacter baumannii]EHU2655486.1 PAAR domain-containing protein [Acinetobacter baumannii]EHU3266090.1 PAAR domain-containing protein [Acinetobacter baumannii]EKT8316710.1 PAAR domain-containing protein [Acinetobacter baumannii]EKU4658198.1 PAAR domain-containing protein [Acinetobacter baumannii]EKV5599013.1 PAAR domain-containing protein [Acinetobacter baumannii]